jgi:hypothetical protein
MKKVSKAAGGSQMGLAIQPVPEGANDSALDCPLGEAVIMLKYANPGGYKDYLHQLFWG